MSIAKYWLQKTIRNLRGDRRLMCGILLAFGNKSVDRQSFDLARDALIHRGPDAQQSAFLENDTLALGHTRLSIIDLSTNGNQPMRNGSLWVIFNGEIYNYPDLRKDLERDGVEFSTNSDTEVLLHGYRSWGIGLSEKLQGMFAFAIWDSDKKEIYLARDHFGQKPLYYSSRSGRFVAASEIKAIKQFVGSDFCLRKASIVDAMVQDFVAEPNTWYEDIFAVPPGHYMKVKLAPSGVIQRSLSSYWNFKPAENPLPISESEALDHLEEELNHAISSHLLADVEVGAFLSGGVDSNCITTLASQVLDLPIRTFSMGFDGDDELPLARETVQRIGANHQEGRVTEKDYQSFSDRSLEIFDYPFGDTSIVPMERVSALATQSVKVVLTGDGGDETFGGYNYGKFISPKLAPATDRKIGLAAIRAILNSLIDRCAYEVLGGTYYAKIAKERILDPRRVSTRRRSILAPALLSELSGYDPADTYAGFREDRLSAFRNAQWIGIKVPLPSRMLVKVDRCSMAHSLETRAPFLAPNLVECVLNLPLEITNPRDNWFKGLLRTWLKEKIPENVLHAKKRGFDVPLEWASFDNGKLHSSKEALPNCVDANLVCQGGWEKLRRAPRVLWYFDQIERALEKGVLKC